MPADTVAHGATPPNSIKPLVLRERLHAMQTAGPKYATGIEELDKHLRGGIREGEVMVIGGAPGAGKSTLALQIARNFAACGIIVGWLAVDEAPAGLDTRNMQAILGVPRELAEKPDDATMQRALRLMRDLPFWPYDADATVEDVVRGIHELPGDGPRCLIIDSLQTARTEASVDFDNPRQRIDELFNYCKRAARHPDFKCILIFTSELARGAYRSKRSADNSDPLASFKESGSVEFGTDVALVLQSVRGESDLVRAELVKCRPGTKGEFNLRLDFARATFVASSVTPADVKGVDAANYEFLKLRVLEFVSDNPGKTKTAVRDNVKGRAETVSDALTDLETEGKIRGEQNGRATRWFPIRSVVPDSSQSFPEQFPVGPVPRSHPLRGGTIREPVAATDYTDEELGTMADNHQERA